MSLKVRVNKVVKVRRVENVDSEAITSSIPFIFELAHLAIRYYIHLSRKLIPAIYFICF